MKNKYLAHHLEFLEVSQIRQIMNAAPRDAINLGLGEIRFPLEESLKEAAEKIIRTENLYYTPNAGLPELREQISLYYNLEFNQNICVTTGAEEALFATLFTYLNPGDEVVLADPGFVAYQTIIKMLQAKPVCFHLNPVYFHFEPEKFRAKISENTKIVLLNNPLNPTGTTYSEKDLIQISQICVENNILLIVDEVYRELYLDCRPCSILDINPHSLAISSLSKSHGLSGWRLGWIASANPELVKPIIKTHQYICTCANAMAQKLALVVFSEPGDRALENIRQKLLNNRKIVGNFIPENYLLPNASHPYFLVKVKNDKEVTENLLQQKVIVIPGSVFGENAKNWIRINYGISAELLETGLNKIVSIL